MTGPWLALDFETTGISVEADHVVTACTALLKPATPVWSQEITSHLAAVEIDIPDAATQVHGVTTKFARDNGRPPVDVLDEVADALHRAMAARIPIVGANLAYDLTLLDRELRRHDLPTVDERLGRTLAPVIDCMVLDKYIDPYRPGGRKLVNLCETYGIPFVGAHDSTADALAAARVAYRIGLLAQKSEADLFARYRGRKKPGDVVAAFGHLASLSLDGLHQAQIGWRRKQMEGLAAHFKRQGKAFDGDGYWPMRPFVTHIQEALGV
jgi:DNA polymerase-3 subunit epsilon